MTVCLSSNWILEQAGLVWSYKSAAWNTEQYVNAVENIFFIVICYLSLFSSAWLKGSAQSTVGKLDHKISMLTGLNVRHPYGEYLQVVNYGIGGHYEPHFDHATVSGLFIRLRAGW